MTLKSLMLSDASMLFAADDGAVSVIYELPDGTRTTCTGNVWDMLTEARDVRGIQTIVATRNVTIPVSELPSVNLRATMVIDDTEWAITRIIYQDDVQVSVELQRHELHEHARPGYRRQ